ASHALCPREATVRAELRRAGFDRAALTARAVRGAGPRLPRRWGPREAFVRSGTPAARTIGLGRARVRRGREARAERCRSAGSRRRWALLEGEAGARFL